MNAPKMHELVSLIDRYQNRGHEAGKTMSYNSKPLKLVICTECYNINVPLEEYPELRNIMDLLIGYVREVTEVKVAQVKKEIEEVLRA